MCFFYPFMGIAQEPVALKASAPKVVSVGEDFRYVIETNASSGSLTPPKIDDAFTIIAGPVHQQSFQETYSGGKMVRTSSTSFIYVLSATKEGKFAIGEAQLTDEGKVYQSSAVTIEVVKGSASSQAAGANYSSGGGTGVSADDIFVRTMVSKSSAYKGDYLVATIKIYIRPDLMVSRFTDIKFPVFTGFYIQDLDDANTTYPAQRESVDGKVYNTQVLKRYLLCPQTTGKLTIEPLEAQAEVIVQSRARSTFDNFFGAPAQAVIKKLSSPTVTFISKDLPAGAPASFTGAVGDFKMDVSLLKSVIKANEATSLVVKISGTGNMKLMNAPKVQLPSDFEVYDTKPTENFKNSAAGATGYRQFEYPFIPRSAGNFTIYPVEFSYFNPAKGEYITLSSKELALNVERDSSSNQAAVVSSGRAKQDIKYLGTDVREAKTVPQSWKMLGSTFYGSLTYYSLFILAVILFVVLVFILREQNKKRQNVALTRTRKANAVAKKRLSLAGKILQQGNVPGFYEELLKAYWGYLSDKLNIPVAKLSRENIREILSRKNVEQQDIDSFLAVVDECEFARYAPGTGKLEMEHEYENAVAVITKLEQKIR